MFTKAQKKNQEDHYTGFIEHKQREKSDQLSKVKKTEISIPFLTLEKTLYLPAIGRISLRFSKK